MLRWLLRNLTFDGQQAVRAPRLARHGTFPLGTRLEIWEGIQHRPSIQTMTSFARTQKILSSTRRDVSGSTNESWASNEAMTPANMVKYLDHHVVGQATAKRTLANALRNRWRRLQLRNEDLMSEICPQNILMVGPTGVGKTELARRLSKHLRVPFLKVEATKFTEVGFHGQDVDQIIHDLVNVSIRLESSRAERSTRDSAVRKADEIIVEKIFGRKLTTSEMGKGVRDLRAGKFDKYIASYTESESTALASSLGMERSHRLTKPSHDGRDAYDRHTDDSMDDPLGWSGGNAGAGRRLDWGEDTGTVSAATTEDNISKRDADNREAVREATLQEARHKLILSETSGMSSEEDIIKRAILSAEHEGIVFIDEIDKVCVSQAVDGVPVQGGFDVSSVGVQRDLLPLIEGCTVTTKNGPVKTNHILFIAAGAFHSAKPSDLLPELQGRLPVKVALEKLTREDFHKILTQPEHSLIKQQIALFHTEGVKLFFTEQSKWAIATVAEKVNRETENIGARRLHSILERLLETLSFNAPNLRDTEVTITEEMVMKATADCSTKVDYRKYIL